MENIDRLRPVVSSVVDEFGHVLLKHASVWEVASPCCTRDRPLVGTKE